MGKQGKERLFRMKQFNVRHSRSANKVGVDGVLIGAWADVNGAHKILDAGCGCGLISLMLAQRASSAKIVGIEIEEEALGEATENVATSPWADRIKIRSQDFRSMDGKFDLIVSNPPFFHAGMKNEEDSSRILARHAGSLSPESLIIRAHELLDKGGRLAFIAQSEDEESLLTLARESSLSLKRISRVRGTLNGPIKRIMCEFEYIADGKGDNAAVKENLVIELSPGIYSDEYRSLCRDFYIIF